MTFLAPALLVLAAVAAVPLVLHLLHRQRAPRVVFPAIRYLRRAEREHATRIRLRQWLLLALRVLAVLLLAGAAARPFLAGDEGAHPPTAVVIILDNSLSSGAVVGDRRVLDDLADAARLTLAAAGPEDAFWLIRAGAPWEAAVRGPADAVARAVDSTEPTDAGADLADALRRARGILAGARPAAREIHLLSDLQASGVQEVTADPWPPARGDEGIPVVVLSPPAAPANRAVTRVQVGGGFPPRAGERSTVAATLTRSGDAAGDSVDARLTLDGTVRAVARAPVGATVVLPFPAGPAGRVTGHVEIDRDALAADDRRWFVLEVAPPPAALATSPLPFLDEALGVLADAGRVRAATETPDVAVAPAALGIEAIREGAGVLVLPPGSPLERTAANRRLAAADVPWRFEAPIAGDARLDTAGLDLDVLADVRLRQVYGLAPTGPIGRDTVLMRLRSGDPWAVGRIEGDRRYVLLATPLTPAAGTVPTSAAMLPLLDRALNDWLAPGRRSGDYLPGEPVAVAGEAVITPSGAVDTVAGGTYRPAAAGIYRVMAGDVETGAFAVNPPASESELGARVTPDDLPGRIRAAGPEGWADAIYHQRLGRDLTVALLILGLAVLMLESAVAAAGRA